ncbi:MAG TPA: acyl-CoA dehydrogenase family protein, partial [Methylomirabilota bacterium]|nr:acyl-CoA dehydrogenase family protein [Methylomirabilota bacterium]
MDFAWTDEQVAFRDSVVRFAQQELNGDVAGRDQKAEFSWEGWRKCAEFGIHGLPVPARYGGSEADVVTTMLAMEALGYGCRDNGLLFSINAHMWSCQAPIL